LIILTVGLASTAGLSRYVEQTERTQANEEFVRRASARHALISERVRGYEECLYNLHNLFANSEDVTPAAFATTTRDIRTRHPAIQALQSVPVVPAARRAEIDTRARAEIAASFAFTERGPTAGSSPRARAPFTTPSSTSTRSPATNPPPASTSSSAPRAPTSPAPSKTRRWS
jgi:CHASE1-domain containing sensor protein